MKSVLKGTEESLCPIAGSEIRWLSLAFHPSGSLPSDTLGLVSAPSVPSHADPR